MLLSQVYQTFTESYACISSPAVLNDVLDFDRLDAGRFTTTRTPFPIVRAVLVLNRAVANAGISEAWSDSLRARFA